MSDLRSFARETESRTSMPAFETLLARHHRQRRRRALLASVAAVLAVALAAAALGRGAGSRVPSAPASVLTSVAVPSWGAEKIVGHPDAFVVAQLESRSDRSIVLTTGSGASSPPSTMTASDGRRWRSLTAPTTSSSCSVP